MNLKKATLFLIAGSSYTIFHKAIFAVFPLLTYNTLAKNTFSFLWILASLTLILFVYYFLKEITPLNLQIKISLQLVILFTGLIILLKLPIELLPGTGITRNITFEVCRLLNSVSMLVFLISFNKIISEEYSLHQPINLIIVGASAGLVLDLIAFGYYLNFIITEQGSISLPPLQILAVIVFVFTYYALINFLVKFSRVEDYSKLILTA